MAITDDAAQPQRAARNAALERRADELFMRLSHYPGRGFAHHCQRLFEFTLLLLDQRGVRANRSLLFSLARVHDLGLLVSDVEGKNYLERSRNLFHRVFAAGEVDLSEYERRVADECLVYNHRLFAVPGLTPEGQAFRDAAFLEHTRGLRRFGLPHAKVREVFARFPREDFDWVVLDFTRRVLRREPWTVVNGVFF